MFAVHRAMTAPEPVDRTMTPQSARAAPAIDGVARLGKAQGPGERWDPRQGGECLDAGRVLSSEPAAAEVAQHGQDHEDDDDDDDDRLDAHGHLLFGWYAAP